MLGEDHGRDTRATRTVHLSMPLKRIPFRLLLVVVLIELALLIYSQTVAYWGDESLHLVAGQLMNAGKRPYLDFFYQHPPLFAYLIFFLVRVFGESWQVVHAASALLTGGCLMLTAMYVFMRARESQMQLTLPIIATVLLGLNCYVISFGTVALPYGFCLFFTVAAFVLVTGSVDQSGSRFAFAAGVCAGTAAAAYLLTAPIIPVLFVWMMLHNRQGSRRTKCAWYLVGLSLPFVPLLLLGTRAPQQVWVDLVQYHRFHRSGRDLNVWFNLREIAGWFISIQGLALVVLAGAALSSTKWRDRFDKRLGPELHLLIALVFALCCMISVARPTSSFYFVLITPFLAMLAAFGMCAISLRVRSPVRVVCVLLLVTTYAGGLSAMRYVWRRQTSYTDHRLVANIARNVGEVTPAAGMIYAFEAVYFEARRLPPPGLENRFNPVSQADEWLKAGRFDTVCIGSTNPRIETFNLLERYAKHQTVSMNGATFYILWDRTTQPASDVVAEK
jgi:hypothetical protein